MAASKMCDQFLGRLEILTVFKFPKAEAFSPIEPLWCEASSWFLDDIEDGVNRALFHRITKNEINDALRCVETLLSTYAKGAASPSCFAGRSFIALFYDDPNFGLDDLTWPAISSGRKLGYLQLSCALALRQLDRTVLAIRDGNNDDAVNFLTDAALLMMEIREHSGFNLDIKILARSVKKRHERDPRRAEKKIIFECWEEWDRSPERYKSKADFARDMLQKVTHLKSKRKIEDWVRIWRRNGVPEG